MEGEMELNEFGCIVTEEWRRSEKIRAEIKLDEFIVMPNHFHGIVFINDGVHCRATLPNGTDTSRKLERRPRSLSSFIAGFKAYTTKCINELRKIKSEKIWQSGFHERVIRNDKELATLREYIFNNPLKWHLDQENPERLNLEPKTTR